MKLFVNEPPNQARVAAGAVNDNLGIQSKWTLANIASLSAVAEGNTSPVIVAILDSGIDDEHEDLRGRVVNEINLSGSSTVNDRSGHGTFIAGIIAADPDNGLGISGIAPHCRLINIKVSSDTGRSNHSIMAKGILTAVDNGANVINISMAGKDRSDELEEAIDYAWEQGAIVIAGAGNDGVAVKYYPAACANCVSVTSIDETGAIASWANYGDWVDVAAPGCSIYSTAPKNKYCYGEGSSFSTAYVSGIAADLFTFVTDSNGDGRINDEIRQIIESGYWGAVASSLIP